MNARITAAPAVVLLTALSLNAQAPPRTSAVLPPLTEQVEVSVVNVDVTATDRSGNPVEGLTRADFEVLEDGKSQKITNFYSIKGGSPQASEDQGPAPVDAEQFRRRVVVMIDNNFVSKVRRDMAIQALEKFIDEKFQGDYEWSILIVGNGVSPVLPFTQDRQQIHDAFVAVRKGGADLLAQQSKAITVPRPISGDVARQSNSDPNALPSDPTQLESFNRMLEDFGLLQATESTAKALIQTCRALSNYRGKKLVMLVSASMDLTAPPAGYSYAAQRNRAEIQRDIERIQQVMIREATTANVNIYVVNAEGLTGMMEGTDTSIHAFSDVRPDSSVSLARALAVESGGAYLPGNFPAQSYRTIDRLSANFYSLGYMPTHSEDGRYHVIELRTRRSGLNLQYRRGYFDLSSDARLENLMRSDPVFAQNWPLPVSIDIGSGSPLPDGTVLVPIVAKMPLDRITVIPKGSNYVGRVHIFISLFDAKGKNSGFRHFVQQVDIPGDFLRKASQQQFKYTMKFGLRPGSPYKIIVAMRDELSKEIGSATQIVNLKSPSS